MFTGSLTLGNILPVGGAGHALEGKHIHLQEVGCLILNYQCMRLFCMIGWPTVV